MPHSFGLSLLFTNFAENVNQLIMKLWPKHLAGNSYFIAISSFPLRSASIVASLAVRYFFDRSSIDLRSAIEERTKGERRMNDGRSKNHRRSIEEPSKVERKTNEKLSKTDRETIEQTIEKTMTRYFALFGIRSGFVRDALAVRRARKNSVDRKNGVGCSLQGLWKPTGWVCYVKYC